MPKLPGQLMLTIISWREARANKALLAKFKSGGLTSASNFIHGGDLNRPTLQKKIVVSLVGKCFLRDFLTSHLSVLKRSNL